MIISCFMPLSHDPKMYLHHNDFDLAVKRFNINNIINVYQIIFNIIILNNITYLIFKYLIITQLNIILCVLYTYVIKYFTTYVKLSYCFDLADKSSNNNIIDLYKLYINYINNK